MTQLEKDIERKLRTNIETLGGLCLKWVCPGWSGVPDRIILLPGGRIYFVETKRPKGGVVSALQKKWREWLTKLGFSYWLVFNGSDLAAFMDCVKERGKRECGNCSHFIDSPAAEPCASCVECDKWEGEI